MIDKLIDRIAELEAPIVVGLDTAVDMLPAPLLRAHDGDGMAAALAYNRLLIDAVRDLVPAVKPQIAMYERYGLMGLRVYVETCAYAQSRGLFVIGDIKRGDIANSAAGYASHIGGADGVFPWPQDMVTLNPYLGGDSLRPFLDVCAAQDKAVFILVKTSNPGSADLQDLPLASGLTVYQHMADLVSEWGKGLLGRHGYSRAGAVVGATFPEQGRELRQRMPHTFFLVPGYGAQGGKGADLRGFFDRDGRGCIVNSSRGIIAAWKNDPRFDENHAGEAAREAVLAMKADLRGAWA